MLAINMFLPIIGPIINEVADFPSRLSKKRKDRYLEVVIKQLEKTNENLMDKNFIHSDDFIDIIETQATQKAEFELCFDSLLFQGLVFDASLSGMPGPTQMGIVRTPQPRELINISPLAKRAISFIPKVEQILKNAMKKQTKNRKNFRKIDLSEVHTLWNESFNPSIFKKPI